MPFHGHEGEEADVTYGPFVVAVGLLILALTLTLWPLGGIAGLAVVVAGIVVWVRESVKENRTLVPPEFRRGNTSTAGFRTLTEYWWGAFGIGLVQLVATGASLRMAHAHGLLDPFVHVPVTMWIGHLLTALTAVSAILGIWVSVAARVGGATAKLPLSLLLVAVLIHLAVLGLQGLHFYEGPLFSGDLARQSAVWWVFLLHGTFVLAALLAMALMLLRIRIGPIAAERFGVIEAVVYFWWTVLVSWLVIYLSLYVEFIQFQSRFI